MGWLDTIFGGLSNPDYNKMFQERMIKEQQEKEVIVDNSKSTANLKETKEERSVNLKRKENEPHKEEVREERKKEEKAAADLKLVIDGAKIQCALCTNPIGDLKVNFDTPTIQNKKTATVKEKDMKSLMFKGNCTKSPQSSSPCAGVMQLGKWKDVGTSKVQDQFPLLLKSTIKCNFGGSDIKIIDCGQKNEPADIESTPKEAKKEKKILNATWMCAEMEEGIKTATVGDAVSLLVKTRNYKEGESVTLIIDDKNGHDVKEKQKEVTNTGTVDADGRAELKAQVVLESIPEVGKNKVDKEVQQEAAKKNEIFITREGISYTKEQWKEYQNKWHDNMDAANKK